MVASAAWERREEAGTRPAARGCEPGGEGRVCLVSLLPDSDPAGGRVAGKRESGRRKRRSAWSSGFRYRRPSFRHRVERGQMTRGWFMHKRVCWAPGILCDACGD